MHQLLSKIPFLLELFFNGTFIVLFSLKMTDKIPESWSVDLINSAINIGSYFIPIVLFFSVVINYINTNSIEGYLRKHVFSLMVFIPIVITWGDAEFCFWLALAHLISSVLTLYDIDPNDEEPQDGIVKKFTFRPAQLVLISFFVIVIVGTFLLKLPFSIQDGKTLSWVDALFMSTSAVCVTGLSTLSVTDNFSLFGQFILLLMIQIGGIGIMTLSSSLTILLGNSMGMKDRIIMQDLLDVSSLEELFNMIVDIIRYAFIIEFWGGIILTLAFTFEGFELGEAIWYGFFHSISAFCNAGFSLFNNSIESYATNPMIHGTISLLIILGGLGFIVLRELREIFFKGKSYARITLHTRIVLWTNFFLIAGGAIMFFFGEFLNALDGYSLWGKVQVSFFQSVTLRTAGFNSIPLTSLHSYTIYAMALLMFIGASPGSTGGGIKTTTLAILIQSIKSTLKGQKNVWIFKRNIAGPIVVRATALAFISIIITSIFILFMMRLEPDQSFLTVFFEVVSASGTVGLSLGITPFLSVFGKLAISVLMFIGRVGPLTLVLAIGEKKSSGAHEFPDGRVMIG